MDDPTEGVGGALQRQDAAGVLVDEEKLVAQRSKALAHPGPRSVVRRQMRRGEARRHAEGGPEMQGERGCLGERRALFADRVGELVPAQRGEEIHADAAEDAERAVETIAGVALGQQRRHEDPAFVTQHRLERIAAPGHIAAMLPGEVELLEFGVHLDEGSPDPMLERLGTRHDRNCAIAAASSGLVTALMWFPGSWT